VALAKRRPGSFGSPPDTADGRCQDFPDIAVTGLEKPMPAKAAGTVAKTKSVIDVLGFSDAKKLPAKE
jgi:hypothetical protein